ncbi:MAG: enoyl-CoA hydratase/isomerase family protein [Candidatus Acidiferrales bacterium]
MNYETLRWEMDSGVATITLARPEKRNAISGRMIEEMLGALGQAEKSAARVVILGASGKAFCAGMDLEELQGLAAKSREENLEDSRRMAALFRRIHEFPHPVIAAVNGPALAGGCGIATLADFTLAAPEAKFGYTEVKIGFIPALVSVYLRRQIGQKRARDLLLTGRIIGAEEALRLGLVTEIIPAEQLAARARELAASLLAVSPTSVERTKGLLLQFDEKETAEEIEWAIRANAEIRATEDFREGLASFLEKRAPRWSGQ